MAPEDFQDFKDKKKKYYQTLESVSCPVLRARVTFSSDGWYHLLFKTSREKRTVIAQRSRLNLLPLVIPVLKNAKSVDETRLEKNKTLKGQKIDAFYALVWQVGKNNGARVKVVVRKSSNGGYHFHSVMKLKTKNTP